MPPFRNDTKSFAGTDSINLKISTVDGKYGSEPFTLGKVHERRVGEIHWAIRVSLHQGVDYGQLRVIDGCQSDRAGTDQPPSRIQLVCGRTNEVEEFREHGFRRD